MYETTMSMLDEIEFTNKSIKMQILIVKNLMVDIV